MHNSGRHISFSLVPGLDGNITRSLDVVCNYIELRYNGKIKPFRIFEQDIIDK